MFAFSGYFQLTNIALGGISRGTGVLNVDPLRFAFDLDLAFESIVLDGIINTNDLELFSLPGINLKDAKLKYD